MNTKKLTLSLILFFLAAPVAWALEGTPQQRFEEANKLYEQGQLDQAYSIYNELVNQGFSGPALYYNMGNYFYRQGNRGKAVLWYERAKQGAPRDADIQFNLNLAESHIKNINQNIFEDLIDTFTQRELSWVTLVFIWMFFGVLGLTLMGYGKGRLWANTFLWGSGFCLLFSFSWLLVNITLQSKSTAIVTIPPGEVRNGPGEEYAVGFTIPEGSKVLILNKRPEWTEVGAPQEGLKGWIPTHQIEEINLRLGLS